MARLMILIKLKLSWTKLIYESLIAGGILQQALGDGDHLGGSINASIIKDYKKDSSTDILNKRFIAPDYLIGAIAKISNSSEHSDIVPEATRESILENDYLLNNFNKIIAINAINFLIKYDANQDKITNNNSAIRRDIYEEIDKEAGNKSPNNTINKPTLLQKLGSVHNSVSI